MAPGISGYSDAFRQFVDFAQQRIDAGDGKSVIVAQSAEAPLAGRQIESVSSSETDKAGFLHFFVRSDDDKQANERTFALFRAAVAEMFEGKGGIPDAVENALKQAESSPGRPLTARTILAVQNAVDATGPLEAGDASDSGSASSVSAQLAVQDGMARSGPTILDKLAALMSRAGQKTITSVDVGDLKKTLRFTKVPFKQRDILYTFARQASATLAQIDKLKYLVATCYGWGQELNNFRNMVMTLAPIKTAYTLDGGLSASLVFMNNKFNNVQGGSERAITDIIYFASAWDLYGESK